MADNQEHSQDNAWGHPYGIGAAHSRWNDTLLMIGFPMGAWQAALAYVLLVASLAALIAKFGSVARSWS